MIDQKLINRINELAKKNKAEGLTPAETKEAIIEISKSLAISSIIKFV